MRPLSQDKRLAAIYNDLKKIPIPIPSTTPFDTNSLSRDTYLSAFREGWDFAISGRILYATQIAPAGMPSDLFSVWQAGACEGAKLGSEQLMAKLDLSTGVQLPESTPYDANPQNRALFLRNYADGYRDGIVGTVKATASPISNHYLIVMRQGYRAGHLAGWEILWEKKWAEISAEFDKLK
jgi:hypothetical protein